MENLEFFLATLFLGEFCNSFPISFGFYFGVPIF
jgi:hypothetical protein